MTVTPDSETGSSAVQHEDCSYLLTADCVFLNKGEPNSDLELHANKNCVF